MSPAPRSVRTRTTAEPRKPAPPVTSTRALKKSTDMGESYRAWSEALDAREAGLIPGLEHGTQRPGTRGSNHPSGPSSPTVAAIFLVRQWVRDKALTANLAKVVTKSGGDRADGAPPPLGAGPACHNSAMAEALRVAMTLEQCWHRVPGGTAVATLELARALTRLDGLDLVGVAARHARAPQAAWRSPVEVVQLPLFRLALYESWHRLRRPVVQRATGPVDLVHATAMPVPPRSAPLVLTMHDLAFLREPAHFTRRGNSFFRRGLELALRDADLVLCPSRATMDDCVESGFAEQRLRLVPHGVSIQEISDSDIGRVRT